jgi:hydroxymethylpyrimidine/phosphomethylpyrimidine kinase
MVAKGGASLIDPDAIDALKRLLIARAEILTPNLPEAEILCGRKINTVAEMRAAGETLLALGCRAVLVKGGHLSGDTVSDVLVTAAGAQAWQSARLQTRHTHGTGCTLASAIAAGLAQGLHIEQAIAGAPGLGRGHGPLDHAHPLRSHQ